MARKDQYGSSENITCKKCGKEMQLYYNLFDEVVSQSRCKCKPIIKTVEGLKPLDYAIKILGGKKWLKK